MRANLVKPETAEEIRGSICRRMRIAPRWCAAVCFVSTYMRIGLQLNLRRTRTVRRISVAGRARMS